MICEHNPEIDWHTGDIHMTRCLASCRLNMPQDNLIDGLAGKTKGALEAKAHHWVYIEEVPEMEPMQPSSTETEPLPGFTHLDSDEMS